MAIQVVHYFKSERHQMYKIFPGGDLLGMQNDKYLIIKLQNPSSRLLGLIARSMLLALLIVSFPWMGMGSMLERTLSFKEPIFGRENIINDATTTTNINFELLSLFFRDLSNEGILKAGDKSLLVTNGDEDAIYNYQILIENKMDIISATDLDRQKAIPNESFDFIFTHVFHGSIVEFINRTLKMGGIVAVKISENPSFAFKKPLNYKIIYFRWLESMIIGIKKMNNDIDQTNFMTQRRRLCTLEERKAALKNLEDVLLEPPRAASRKSSKYMKKTRYLPDLMGDTLESYPRLVFIDVGLPGKEDTSTGWFAKNYPTRNLNFEIYKIETVMAESSGKDVAEIGMSSWLRKHVKEEEYVVMKAEAEVVEEMVRSKAIKLVDELFLECRPKGHGRGGRKMYGSRRAYWECLALYGRLRDEGVAVHQWWG